MSGPDASRTRRARRAEAIVGAVTGTLAAPTSPLLGRFHDSGRLQYVGRPTTTLNLKTHVHTRPVGERPCVELEPTDHPLAVEQRTGITLDRVLKIATAVLHPGDGQQR